VVVAYAVLDYFSDVATATVAPVNPPKDNASVVFPHPASCDLAAFNDDVVC